MSGCNSKSASSNQTSSILSSSTAAETISPTAPQTTAAPNASFTDPSVLETDLTVETDSVNISDELRPDFKNAMDSYEAFIDEYCTFAKKYSDSNGTDVSLLADYASYMQKLADMEQKFDSWESNDLNDAETTYYIEVQARVSQKLLIAAQELN